MTKSVYWVVGLVCWCLCVVVNVNGKGNNGDGDGDGVKPNIIMFFVDDLGYGDVGFNGHPTTHTPNIDMLAQGGRILTSWYSGCPVCSGSRAALMTGRQFARIGTPGVFSPTVDVGLPTNETTIAAQLKKIGYATGAVGKWHLGQRKVYLPSNHGFDKYLGIPYSDDMGEARRSPCPNSLDDDASASHVFDSSLHGVDNMMGVTRSLKERRAEAIERSWQHYVDAGLAPEDPNYSGLKTDPAANFLPLVYQDTSSNTTNVLEQPLDFTPLAQKYNNFTLEFLAENADKKKPFFLYMPFSHVHTTASNQPQMQYAGCQFQNTTARGAFGDALAEVDWLIGNVVDTLKEKNIYNNTLMIFTGDNGPWLIHNTSAGSEGLFTGRASGYWNTGKGSTWEGGIREAAFVHWAGRIAPMSRTSEVVSSLDVFVTLSSLLNISLPTDRVYDGKDASKVWFNEGDGKSEHEFLFFYQNNDKTIGPNAVRYGPWKAHFRTSPGLGGCNLPTCKIIRYSPPLLFNVDVDPSESMPLTENGVTPTDPTIVGVINSVLEAYKNELSTFVYGTLVPAPYGPGELPGEVGVCCNRTLGCDCNGKPYPSNSTTNNYNGSNSFHLPL